MQQSKALEHQISANFLDGQPIYGGALLQSAWLLNRFHVHSSLGRTPFQSLFGRPYKGRVASFGEDMFGIFEKSAKNKVQWPKGISVGKDLSDQDMLMLEGDQNSEI